MTELESTYRIGGMARGLLPPVIIGTGGVASMFAVVTALESGMLVGQWHHSVWAGIVICGLVAFALIGNGVRSFHTFGHLTKGLQQFVLRIPLQASCGAVNAMNLDISGEGDARIFVDFSDYTQAAWGCEASIKTVGAITGISTIPLAPGGSRFRQWRRPLQIRANGRWTGQLLIRQEPTAPRGAHLRSFRLFGNLQSPSNSDNTHVIISSFGCAVRYLERQRGSKEDGAATLDQAPSPSRPRPLAGPDERYRMTAAGSGAAMIGALAFLGVGAALFGATFAIVMAPMAISIVATYLIVLTSVVRPRGPLQIMARVEQKHLVVRGSGPALIEIITEGTTVCSEACVVRTSSERGQSRRECHLNFPSTCGPVNAGEVKIHERGAWIAQIQWPGDNEACRARRATIFAWARHTITVSLDNKLADRRRGDLDCGGTQ